MSNSFEYSSELGINVESSDIIQKCKAILQKFSEEEQMIIIGL